MLNYNRILPGIGGLSRKIAKELVFIGEGSIASYSLRKIVEAYSGFSIRVRRDSDNTEDDIGFLANGNLDEGSLLTFVGANNGFVTKWYDQSGNTRDLLQTINANQAQIVSSGSTITMSGNPTISFDGTNDRYTTGSASGIFTQPNTFFSVAKTDTTAGQRHIFDGFSASKRTVLFLFVDDYAIFTDTGLVSVSAMDTSPHIVTTIVKTGANSSLYEDSIALGTSLNAGTGDIQLLTLGSSSSNSNFWQGDISELIIFNSDKDSERIDIETSLNNYYSIF